MILTSLRSKDGVPRTRFESSTHWWYGLQDVAASYVCFSSWQRTYYLGCDGEHLLCPPMNFLTPGSWVMHDVNNKAVDYLFCAHCKPEFDRVQDEGALVWYLPETVRECDNPIRDNSVLSPKPLHLVIKRSCWVLLGLRPINHLKTQRGSTVCIKTLTKESPECLTN
jgi:hypothetical protein